MGKKHYDQQGRAGIKLLVTAMKRNIERVENRYRNKQTRETCQSLSMLLDGIWEALEEDRPFTVYLGKQLSLAFVFGEEETDPYPGDGPEMRDPINEDDIAPHDLESGWEDVPEYSSTDDEYSRPD